MNNPHDEDRLDQATAARLARLAARPVDTRSLERRLERAMAATQDPADTADGRRGAGAVPIAWRRAWRPIVSAAAVILLGVTLAWFALNHTASPAMAAPAALAQVHYDIARGLAPDLKVASVEQANQLLADQANGVVPVPELPGIMKSCCLQPHAGTTLTCALIERDGRLITVAIADGAKLHSPRGKTITRGDRRFIAHTAQHINMVMAHQADRWLCVMGEIDFEQLADIAAEIRF